MYVEARRRTIGSWPGRVAVALSVLITVALMLVDIPNSSGATLPVTASTTPNPAITATVTITPVPHPGCEVAWEPVPYPGGDLLGVTALSPSEAWIGGTGRVLSWNGV